MKVYIDGFDRDHPKKFCVGYWTIQSEYATITRPLSNTERFHFVRIKLIQQAEEASKSADPLGLSDSVKEIMRITPLGTGIIGGREGNGLITVVFHPELVEDEEVQEDEEEIDYDDEGKEEEEDFSEGTEEEDEEEEEEDELINLSTPSGIRKDQAPPPPSSLPVPPGSAPSSSVMPPPTPPSAPPAKNQAKLASGATYLMGKSSQKFGKDDTAFKPDTTRELICYVRLVADFEENLSTCPPIPTTDLKAARPINTAYHYLQGQRPAAVEDI